MSAVRKENPDGCLECRKCQVQSGEKLLRDLRSRLSLPRLRLENWRLARFSAAPTRGCGDFKGKVGGMGAGWRKGRAKSEGLAGEAGEE